MSGLKLITVDVINEIISYNRPDWQLKSIFNVNKSWSEIGFDDLDLIELVMEIEVYLDIVITDDEADNHFNPDKFPKDIPGIFIQENRDDKINTIIS